MPGPIFLSQSSPAAMYNKDETSLYDRIDIIFTTELN